jgi:F-type H+-transporting ATPase subunit a
MTLLGLLTGMVQAYIFSILAAVYIAAATRVPVPRPAKPPTPEAEARPWTA